MDDFTYGNSPACVSLAKILTELNDSHLNSKISRALHQYARRLYQIYRVSLSTKDKLWAIHHACDDYIAYISTIENEKVRDHAYNVGKMYFKRYNNLYQKRQKLNKGRIL